MRLIDADALIDAIHARDQEMGNTIWFSDEIVAAINEQAKGDSDGVD